MLPESFFHKMQLNRSTRWLNGPILILTLVSSHQRALKTTPNKAESKTERMLLEAFMAKTGLNRCIHRNHSCFFSKFNPNPNPKFQDILISWQNFPDKYLSTFHGGIWFVSDAMIARCYRIRLGQRSRSFIHHFQLNASTIMSTKTMIFFHPKYISFIM